jgi:hypothetical protein
VADLSDVETLQSLPSEAMPWSTSIEFHGGMLDGAIKQLPMMSDVFSPIPFNGSKTFTCDRRRLLVGRQR